MSMTQKKTIKQLMAIGVQRNDAVAFVRAYRKIRENKREDMLPWILEPEPPKIVRKEFPVATLSATYEASSIDLAVRRRAMPDADILSIIHGKLASALGNELLRSRAVKVRYQSGPGPNGDDFRRITAYVRVVEAEY